MMQTKVKTINIDEQYLTIAKSILENGTEKNDRTGTGTKSIFSAQVVHDMGNGFPLLTTKKVFFKGVVTELLWFLRGETNIKWLVENNNNIWVGDAYKFYLEHYVDEYNEELEKKNEGLGWMVQELVNIRPLSKEQFIEKIKTDDEFAKKWGELGPVYGKQWVNWGKGKIEAAGWEHGAPNYHKHKPLNQIQAAIDTLNNNPDSRRIMVSAWNVDDLDNMTLPPCHWAFELYTEELTYDERYEMCCNRMSKMYNPDEKDFDEYNVPKRRLSLKWHQRSVDTFLGLPFNIASYGLLLHMFAQQTNMVPGKLVGDLTNVHIYKNHIEQCEEQLSREPNKLPQLALCNAKDIFSFSFDDFLIKDYEPHPTIKGKISV